MLFWGHVYTAADYRPLPFCFNTVGNVGPLHLNLDTRNNPWLVSTSKNEISELAKICIMSETFSGKSRGFHDKKNKKKNLGHGNEIIALSQMPVKQDVCVSTKRASLLSLPELGPCTDGRPAGDSSPSAARILPLAGRARPRRAHVNAVTSLPLPSQ